MSKIATVKTAYIAEYSSSKRPAPGELRDAIKNTCKKHGVALHNDGRFFVPEARRGRGVGYNGKRYANRSDGRA